MKVKLGGVVLRNPIFAAPMAGVTDRAYRILAEESGCALVFTEMISCQALLYGRQRTFALLDHRNERGPLCVQIFGANPEQMGRAAQIVESMGCDLVDINMGCPVPKVVRGGEGSALMKTPDLAARIVETVVSRVKVPVTVKMRSGWDSRTINAVELSKMVESAGASAVTVHGRTRSQMYSGDADWDIIRRVKQNIGIPVIGNGDVKNPDDAARMIKETGCDAVMIGRASMGNPWIFGQAAHYLQTGRYLYPPSLKERVQVALRHLGLLVETKGEFIGVREMRKHASWYFKGLRGAARLREQFYRIQSYSDFESMLNSLVTDGSTC